MESVSQIARAKGLSAHDLVLARRSALFRGLRDEALVRLLGPASLIVAARGQTLFVQGEPGERFFILLSGWVKLYRMSGEGGEAVVSVVAPGESFAEAALFLSARFPVSAEAVDRARLLVFARDDLMRLMNEDPGVAMAMLASLSVRLRSLVGQIEQLHAHSAPKRVGWFFLKLCQSESTGAQTVELPFDKALIARRLGMQPETFSRALRQLRGPGVTVNGAVVTIDDVAQLRDFCGGMPDD